MIEKYLKKQRWAFLFLLAVLFLINLPYFLELVLPIHDTMLNFQSFYFFYNELFLNGELAKWIPFGFYGVQSDFYFIGALSPAKIFAGVICWALGIENVLLVFNIGLFLEQFLMLLGMYLLSGALFASRTAVVFVCISAIGATLFVQQEHFNFLAYYLLPFIFYFIVLFFKEYRIHYLLIAAIILVISLSSISYLITLPFLSAFVFSAVLFLFNLKNLRKIRPGRNDIYLSAFYSLILLFAVAVYFYYLNNAMDHVESLSRGRDHITGAVSLNVFMKYGFETGFDKFWNLILPGKGLFLRDNISLYAGLIPVVFALYGAVFAANRWFAAFAAVALAIGLLSLGEKTFFAEFLYNYFPTMKYYRHIGYGVANFKILVPLLAGFGVDSLLRKKAEGASSRFQAATAYVLALIIAAQSVSYFLLLNHGLTILHLVVTSISIVLLLAVRRRMEFKKFFPVQLISLTLIGIIGYVGLITVIFRVPSELQFKEYVKVSPYGFLDMRGWPLTERFTGGSMLGQSTTPYVMLYSFLQWDPCVSKFRTDFINKDVAVLIRESGGKLSLFDISVPQKNGFSEIIGCVAPKLKIYDSAVYAKDRAEALNTFKKAETLEGLLVVETQEKNFHGSADGPSVISVKDFSMNSLEVEAFVSGSSEKWLYYSDAWHPGWKGFNGGEQIPVEKANIGFKAVKLKQGLNRIKLVFDNGFSTICAYIIIAICMVFTSIFLAWAALLILRELKGGFYKNS